MKKLFKKALSVCLSLAFTISIMTLNVTATEILNGLSKTPPVVKYSGISTYDNNYPTETWNLSTDGMYAVSGKANGKAELYTLYMFTCVDNISISLSNYKDSALTVTLYKVSGFDKKVDSFTVSANTNKGKQFTNLSKKGSYYFTFSAPCDFSGRSEERR